ncbi:MAG TPA: cell division protein SepF [Actinocrinis sp.]|jgi:cell division inhibitor SepF
MTHQFEREGTGMPGIMKKAAVYLGLMEGDDPYAYDEYAEEGEDQEVPQESEGDDGREAYEEVSPLLLGEQRRPREAAPADPPRRDTGDFGRPAPVSLLPERAERSPRYDRSQPAVLGSVGFGGGGGNGGGSGEEVYRITTLHPRSYSEARTIGEHFREGTPVIMNLSEMADADAKRLVDFAAGLIFGLRGDIERVTQKVFLLSPANVDVTAEDKARIAEGGFFNQS